MEKRDMEPVVLGGRRFLPLLDGNLAHELEVMALQLEAGLNGLVIREGEAPEDFISRITEDLWKSRKVLQILGCLLIPEELDPEKWTPKDAETTAAFMATVKGPDKAKVKDMIQVLILDFFEKGMLSFWLSPRSSPGAHPDKDSSGSDAPIAMASGAR